MARSTSAGVPAITQAGAWSAGAAREMMDVMGNGNAQVLSGTTDAISFPGTTMLNSTVLDVCTLVLPNPGPQPLGDDGKQIEVIDVSGKLHTITTPTNGINGSKHILTWNGTAGSNVTLQAWNGSWWTVSTPNGVTIT